MHRVLSSASIVKSALLAVGYSLVSQTIEVSESSIQDLIDALELKSDLSERVRAILRYHWRSKHFVDVQAELPSRYMDWDSQPSPWRSYLGAPIVQLHQDLLSSLPMVSSAPLTEQSLASFLRLAAGISAWKSYDGVHKWALRVAPSSGNLQTTELYLLLPGMDVPFVGTSAVYHYQPEKHTLALRLPSAEHFVLDRYGRLVGFLVIFSTLCVREAWKYGERALRSCHLNLGHAIGAVLVSAEIHGWTVKRAAPVLDSMDLLHTVLGLAAAPKAGTSSEEEIAEIALLVQIDDAADRPVASGMALEDVLSIYGAASPQSFGSASPLTQRQGTIHQTWPFMDEAQSAASVSPSEAVGWHDYNVVANSGIAELRRIDSNGITNAILRRRSALKMESNGPAFPRESFLTALQAMCMAGLPIKSKAHVLLMLHNVQDMLPGLYVLLRDIADLASLRDFAHRAGGLPNVRDVAKEWGDESLMLDLAKLSSSGCELLMVSAPADVKHVAQISACGQEIAAEGNFAAVFFARFDNWKHPHQYAECFWDAGVLGQVLYLAAHMAGFGATGIGCFFDDFATSLLSDPFNAEAFLNSSPDEVDASKSHFQSVYHFSVGTPGVDPRLLTFDPYHHLEEAYLYEPMQGGVSRIMHRM